MSDTSSAQDPWAKYRKPPEQAPVAAAPAAPNAQDPWAKYRKPPPGVSMRPAAPLSPEMMRAYNPPAPAPGVGETAWDVVKSLGSGAVKFGTEDISALPGALARGGVWLGHKAGIKGGDVAAQRITEAGQKVSDIANRLTGHAAEYEPKTTLGQYGKTVGEFLPGAVLPGGEALMAGRVGEAALAAGGGALKGAVLPGVASEAAGQATKGTALEPYARAGGALLGAGAGSLGRGVVSPRVTPGVVQAGERLGVDVPRYAAAESTTPRRIGETIGKIPVAGDVIPRAAEAAREQLGGAAAGAARDVGVPSEPALAGAHAKQALGDWVTDTSTKRVSDAYDRAAQLMDPAARAPLDRTQSVMSEILARRQAAGMADKVGPAVKSIKEAVQNTPGGLTFNGLKDLRTSIGQKMAKGNLLPEDWNPAEVKQIYGALSEDLEKAAQTAGGPQGAAAWRRANIMASSDAGRRQALTKLIGVNEASRSGEGVFNAITNLAKSTGGNAKTLAQARRSVSPEEWNNLSASVVERLGRDPNGVFSPERFLTSYGQMSPAGRKILFGGQGNLAQSLEDIATISSRFKQMKSFGNPSGTGQIVAGVGELGAAAHAGLSAMASGSLAEPLSVAASMAGTNVIGRLLARPATASSLARWSSAYQRYTRGPAPAAATALLAASRNLANTTNSELGTNYAADHFMPAGANAPTPAFGGSGPFIVRVPPRNAPGPGQ